MNIFVKLEVVSKTQNVYDFFVEEGGSEIMANTYNKEYSRDQMSGISYEAVNFEVDGLEIEVVELDIEGKTLIVNSTLEDFEEMLSQLGLLNESCAEVIDFTSITQNEDSEEMVA